MMEYLASLMFAALAVITPLFSVTPLAPQSVSAPQIAYVSPQPSTVPASYSLSPTSYPSSYPTSRPPSPTPSIISNPSPRPSLPQPTGVITISNISPKNATEGGQIIISGRNFSKTRNTVTLQPVDGTGNSTVDVVANSSDGQSISVILPLAYFGKGKSTATYNVSVASAAGKSAPAQLIVAKAPKNLYPKIAVVFIEFKDVLHDSNSETESSIRQKFITDPISVSKVIKQSTYGQLNITDGNLTVIPWVKIDYLVSDVHNISEDYIVNWMEDAAKKLARQTPSIKLSSFDQVFFVAPREVTFDARGQAINDYESRASNLLGKSRHPVFINESQFQLVYLHEFGHAYFDLDHTAAIDNCPTGDFAQNLNNCGAYNYSTQTFMGAGMSTAPAYQRRKMNNILSSGGANFFEKERVESISHTNIKTDGIYTISAIEDASKTYKKALKIEGDNSRSFWVEYRRPTGVDSFASDDLSASDNQFFNHDNVWVSMQYEGDPFKKDFAGDDAKPEIDSGASGPDTILLKASDVTKPYPQVIFDDPVDHIKITLLSLSANNTLARIKVEYACSIAVANPTLFERKYTPAVWTDFLYQEDERASNYSYGIYDTNYIPHGAGGFFDKGWYSVRYLGGANVFQSPITGLSSYFISTLKTKAPIIGQNLCERPATDTVETEGICPSKYGQNGTNLTPTPDDYYSAQTALRNFYDNSMLNRNYPGQTLKTWENSVLTNVDKISGFGSLTDAENTARQGEPYMLYVPQNGTLLKFSTVVEPRFLHLFASEHGYPTYEICPAPEYVPPNPSVTRILDPRLKRCAAPGPYPGWSGICTQ